jgi:hypothetical protein
MGRDTRRSKGSGVFKHNFREEGFWIEGISEEIAQVPYQ